MPTHLVFSTKNRVPVLKPQVREELYLFIGAVLREHKCPLLQVGAVDDHIHLLFDLARTICLADAVKEVKVSSSRWIKDRFAGYASFAAGYGAFGVSAGDVEGVRRYIEMQEEHHHRWSYQDELRKLLTEARMEWDERYVWD